MSTAVVEEKKTGTKLNQLEQLKKFTKVVADTADFESIKQFKPQDATTNPSLVYAATQKPEYAHLLEGVFSDRKKSGLTGAAQIEDICDHLLVQFGTDTLKVVPGAFRLRPMRDFRSTLKVRLKKLGDWLSFTRSAKFRANVC